MTRTVTRRRPAKIVLPTSAQVVFLNGLKGAGRLWINVQIGLFGEPMELTEDTVLDDILANPPVIAGYSRRTSVTYLTPSIDSKGVYYGTTALQSFLSGLPNGNHYASGLYVANTGHNALLWAGNFPGGKYHLPTTEQAIRFVLFARFPGPWEAYMLP